MSKSVDRPPAALGRRIILLRGARVILDVDLAAVYGVETRALNQAIRRNGARFPHDFAFPLTVDELGILKSQFVISSAEHGGRRSIPWAFTEHGAIMAAMVLRSDRAIAMSVFVVRAFARLRSGARATARLRVELAQLERRVTGHDGQLRRVLAAIRALLPPPQLSRRRIGF